MAISTEQAAINNFYPDDDTKTIEDVINVFVDCIGYSRTVAIDTIKNIDIFSDVSDWSV